MHFNGNFMVPGKVSDLVPGMRTVGVIGGVGDCEGASKGISKVVKAPVKEFQQYVQVKPQKQNTKSRKEI